MTEKLKLKECCEVITDGDHLPPPKATHGIPFITISNINANNEISFDDTMYVPIEYYDGLSETKKAKSEDVLLSVVGSFGKPVYIEKDEKFTFQRHIALLRHNNKVDGRFLYYTLLNPQFYKTLDKLAIGCSQRTVTLDTLRNIEIDVPRLDIQRKIVDCLSAIDEKIKINNSINNNLIETIDTIYKEFVFSDRAKKSDFKVQNMFKNDLYSLIKPGVSQFDTKTYYATSEVNGMYISDGWTISYDNRESRANMTPTLYSVWFAKMKNSIKHLFLNDEMSNFVDNSILSTGFYGLQCNELTFEYVASVIHNSNFEKLKDILSHGATQQGIGDDDLKNIKLLVPSQELLKEYHNKTAPMFSLISKNINENNALIQLRNELLPLLMNGQATVGD